MTISFSKYQGTGNDFILVEDLEEKFQVSNELISSLCHRKFGVGADGFILLLKSKTADFRMRIFNSDGKEASFCGNGLLCLLKFISDLGFEKKNYSIETKKMQVSAGYGEKGGYFKSKAPKIIEEQAKVGGNSFFWIDTGVPHAVLFVKEVENIDVEREGAKIRNHPYFAPEGVNVDFATMGQGFIKVRTFERGVEAETLSCGSGAIASAVAAMSLLGAQNPLTVNFKHGSLEVLLKEKEVILNGSSSFVFSGKWSYA